MPKTQMCSHSSMATIMVNHPVLRKEPDFILQSTAMRGSGWDGATSPAGIRVSDGGGLVLWWGTPMGAPWEVVVPVLPRLILEDVVAIGHLLIGQGVDVQVWVHLHHLQQRLVG